MTRQFTAELQPSAGTLKILAAKAVTDARHGENIMCRGGIWLNLTAELRHKHAEQRLVLGVTRPPYCPEQSVVGYCFSCMRHEVTQDCVLCGSQVDLTPL